MNLASSDRIKYFNKMAGERRFNPSGHRVKGDRLVRAIVLPVCHNACLSTR